MTTLNISQKNVNDGKNTFFKNNKMLIGTAAPTSGTYTRGDVVVNAGLDNDKNNMWICIESGSPGKWILIGGKPMITSRARVVITDPIAEVPMTELGMPVEKDDKLDVYLNSTHLLEGEDYIINSSGTKIRKKSGIWNLTGDPAVFDFVLMKYVDKVDGNNVTINTENRETKIASIVEKVQVIGTQTEVAIPNMNFNQEFDTLLVFKNGMIMIDGIDYQISNGNLVSLTGPWNQSDVDDYEMTFILLKEVLVYEGVIFGNFQEKIDSNLQTNDKTVVGAINELFQSANNGKELIASAIGEPLSSEDTFSAMSDKINDMKSDLKQVLTDEGVNVTEEDNMNSLIAKVDGEFNDKNTEISSLNTELAGKVTPAGTAVAGDVLSGKTFINSTGQTVTGTMANRGGAQTVTPGTSNKTLNAGYYSGNITVAGDADLIAANIVSGKNIFGVAGTATIPTISAGTTYTTPKITTEYSNTDVGNTFKALQKYTCNFNGSVRVNYEYYIQYGAYHVSYQHKRGTTVVNQSSSSQTGAATQANGYWNVTDIKSGDVIEVGYFGTSSSSTARGPGSSWLSFTLSGISISSSSLY